MADIARTDVLTQEGVQIFKWTPVTEDDAMLNVEIDAGWRAVVKTTLHVFGTWGGATAKLQGSLDGTNWVDVTDASMTEDGYVDTQDSFRHYRVVLSGGAAQSLTVVLGLWKV